MILTRRNLLLTAGAGLVTGCDTLGQNPTFREVLKLGEKGNFAIQRSLQQRSALAREFDRTQISPIFRVNGTHVPAGEAYAQHTAEKFVNWRLRVEGLVNRPLAISPAQLQQMPKRTQITRHDCVEGWSAIGEWTGAPLKLLLDAAGLIERFEDGRRVVRRPAALEDAVFPVAGAPIESARAATAAWMRRKVALLVRRWFMVVSVSLGWCAMCAVR